MLEHDELALGGQLVRLFQDVEPVQGMPAHLRHLLVGQAPFLHDHSGVDPGLSQVVKEKSDAQLPEVVAARTAEVSPGHQQRQNAHIDGMRVGVGVVIPYGKKISAQVIHLQNAVDHLVEPFLGLLDGLLVWGTFHQPLHDHFRTGLHGGGPAVRGYSLVVKDLHQIRRDGFFRSGRGAVVGGKGSADSRGIDADRLDPPVLHLFDVSGRVQGEPASQEGMPEPRSGDSDLHTDF